MTQKTGFAYHPDYLNHDTGPGHPERQDRLRASLAALQQSDLWDQLHQIEPTPASIEQIAYAHNPAYSEHIRQHCEKEIPLTYDTLVGFESLILGYYQRTVSSIFVYVSVRQELSLPVPSRLKGIETFHHLL